MQIESTETDPSALVGDCYHKAFISEFYSFKRVNIEIYMIYYYNYKYIIKGKFHIM